MVHSVKKKERRWSGRISLKKEHTEGYSLWLLCRRSGDRVLEKRRSKFEALRWESLFKHMHCASYDFYKFLPMSHTCIIIWFGNNVASSYLSYAPRLFFKLLKKNSYGRCCIIIISFKLEWKKLVLFCHQAQQYFLVLYCLRFLKVFSTPQTLINNLPDFFFSEKNVPQVSISDLRVESLT